MILWKNKPITELSEKELKTALGQSVVSLLSSDETRPGSDGVFLAFLMGFVTAFLLFAGIALLAP